jgi:uncharacterized membrane protein
MQRQLKRTCLLAFSSLLGLALSAPAGGQTYTTIDYPGSPATLAVDINDFGQIAGEYVYGTTIGQRNGFVLSNGVFTSITYPGATFTRAIGINRYGDIVGDHQKEGNNIGMGNQFGYLLKNGVFTNVQVPNSELTTASGINSNEDIVGWYNDKKGTHGFLLRAGVYTSIDFPGAAAFTQAWKINDSGEIVGRYTGANDGKYHIFILSNGSFTAVPDVPEAFETAVIEAGGLNSNGDIVTQYCSAKPCGLGSVGDVHGFLLSGGVYTTFDYPGAALTMAFGLNSYRAVVGGYQDSNGAYHGYLRTP